MTVMQSPLSRAHNIVQLLVEAEPGRPRQFRTGHSPALNVVYRIQDALHIEEFIVEIEPSQNRLWADVYAEYRREKGTDITFRVYPNYKIIYFYSWHWTGIGDIFSRALSSIFTRIPPDAYLIPNYSFIDTIPHMQRIHDPLIKLMRITGKTRRWAHSLPHANMLFLHVLPPDRIGTRLIPPLGSRYRLLDPSNEPPSPEEGGTVSPSGTPSTVSTRNMRSSDPLSQAEQTVRRLEQEVRIRRQRHRNAQEQRRPGSQSSSHYAERAKEIIKDFEDKKQRKGRSS